MLFPLAVEVTWQMIGGAFVTVGIIAALGGWAVVKFYEAIKSTADESLRQQAEGYKRLFEIEKENNAQHVRNITSLQQSYNRIEDELKSLRVEMRDKGAEHDRVVELNIKHQETIRTQNHAIANHENVMTLLRKANEDLQKENDELRKRV